jgi:hypothetical protein
MTPSNRASRMMLLRLKASAMNAATASYDSLLKSVLPLGQPIVVHVGSARIDGTVARYVLPDEGDIRVKPEPKFESFLGRVLDQYGNFAASLDCIELR